MRHANVIVVGTLSLLVAAVGCGNDPEIAAGANGGDAAVADRSERELVALIDQRVALALARERAVRHARRGEGRLKVAIDGVGDAVRSRLQRTGEEGGEQAEKLAALSSRLDGLSAELDELGRDAAAVEGLRAEMADVLDEVRSGGYGSAEDWADYEPADGDAWTEADGPAEGEGELPFMDAVVENLTGAMTVLDRVERARARVEEIVSGQVPEPGEDGYEDYVYDEYGYEDDPYEDEWYGEDDYHEDEDYSGEGDYDESWDDEEYAESTDLPVGDETADEPLAASVEHDSHPGLAMELLDLRRTAGGTLTLELAIVNRTGDGLVLDGILSISGPYNWGLRKVGLIDMNTGTRYSAMRDDQGNYLASSGGYGNRDLPDGERRELWVRFAEVPAELTVVSVNVPGFPLIDGVPIRG